MRHQVEASRFSVSTRMTAWQRQLVVKPLLQFSPAPVGFLVEIEKDA